MGLRRFFWHRIVGSYPVNIRGERFSCSPEYRRTWRRISRDKWERGTLDILDAHLSTDSVIWDIGAHVGEVALYASRKCKRVVCFEPDLAALSILYKNLSRNRIQNVTVVGAALAEQTSFLKMGGFWDGSSLGSSITSSRPAPDAETLVAAQLGPAAWSEWLRTEPPDLIKMDIEGGEFELLPAMAGYLQKNRPKLLVSFHAGPLRSRLRMSTEEARQALDQCTASLSFYEEFIDLSSGEKLPMPKLTELQMGGSDPDNPKLLDGIFLE